MKDANASILKKCLLTSNRTKVQVRSMRLKKKIGRGMQAVGFISTFFIAAPLADMQDLSYFFVAVGAAIMLMILGALMEEF